MLEKIISGGQTGADRAALDVAIKFNIPHGGWIPRGRRAEDGPLPMKYLLSETRTRDYRERTRQNILDAHGTVIISRGELSGGSLFTLETAALIDKPCCALDLMRMEEFEAAMTLQSFIDDHKIRVLNVAGPRQTLLSDMYSDVKTVLEVTLYLMFLETGRDQALQGYIPDGPVQESFPETLEDGLTLLYQKMPLRTRTLIARTPDEDIGSLYFVFLEPVRRLLGMDEGNPRLVKDCAAKVEETALDVEDAVMIILKKFKQRLEKDHILRVVS